MARIRYLKPEFFQDEDLGELPFETRLAFAGLWCFADKSGRLEDRPKFLKAMIFPFDNVDMEQQLSCLATAKNGRGFIQRYEIGGKRYIQIVNWEKHQRPHHTERESQIPPPPPESPPLTIPPLLKQKEMGMGMGMENQLEASAELRNGVLTVKAPLSPVIQTPEEFLSFYHELCPSLPRVLKLTVDRKKKILLRLKENSAKSFWIRVFSEAERILIPSRNGRPEWRPDLDFLIRNESNYVKILERKYPARSQKHRQPAIEALLREEVEHETQ